MLSIANYLWLAFLDVALLALHPLFFATSIRLGGLGMSPATIGLCLGGFGLLDGVAHGLFFPKVIRRVGLKKLFLTSVFLFIPMFATFPVVNHFARKWGLSPAVWGLIVFHFMISCATEMAFGRCSSLNLPTSLTLLPPRLRVPIHNILCGDSAGTWERARDRTNRCFTHSSTRPGGGDIPLCIHSRE